jgi:hypothetical protein
MVRPALPMKGHEMNDPRELADWQEFKTLREDCEQPVCPFCGIRHEPMKTHPYCTMATEFRFWRMHRNSS